MGRSRKRFNQKARQGHNNEVDCDEKVNFQITYRDHSCCNNAYI